MSYSVAPSSGFLNIVVLKHFNVGVWCVRARMRVSVSVSMRAGASVRTCGRVGVWACGRVGVWACGRVGVCACVDSNELLHRISQFNLVLNIFIWTRPLMVAHRM